MELILTNHARKRMSERGINLNQVKEVINFPDYTIRKNGKIEVNKKISNRSLRVVYILKGKFIKIITVVEK